MGIELNLSANSPSRDGHASAKPSYVTRPSNCASDATVSSSLNLLPSSPRSNSNAQPLWRKSSAPPGSSTTPSSDMNSVTTILPMSNLLLVVLVPPEPGVFSNYQLNTLEGLHVAVDQLSTTFAALADPTRRAILGRLADGDATVSELAEPFPMSAAGGLQPPQACWSTPG